MRPQATHSRWLQWGHLQWVLKSPWWQRLQQPGMPALSSVLAGPWPANHGREEGQRGLTHSGSSCGRPAWRSSFQQGASPEGKQAPHRCPHLLDSPCVSSKPSQGWCGPHLPSSCPTDFPMSPELPTHTTCNTFLHPPLSPPPKMAFFRGLSIKEEILRGHAFPHPEFQTRFSLISARTPVSKCSLIHSTNTLSHPGLGTGIQS